MTRPLAGIRVVEVGMWAFVPSAAAMLGDWGAEVIKIEHPKGDPIRGLVLAGIDPAQQGATFMWEIFNRGKRSVALDLQQPGAREILLRLVDTADVFLVSLLPAARRKLGIDADDVRERNPRIIYAAGTGQGPTGDESEKGGYDSISFWARSGVSSAVTPDDYASPLPMPAAAFGDSLSGAMLAGGIAAAVAHRERTGEGSVVEGSLLATGMWAMQASIVGAHVRGTPEMPKLPRSEVTTPMANTYRTADDRWVALCMIEGDKYWPGLCHALGRDDLVDDARFATDADRSANIEACIAELDAVFAGRTLAAWREAMAQQPGQWDVVKQSRELVDDPQAVTNGFVQRVVYADGGELPMVSAPVQFDRTPPALSPAPALGADTEAVLREAGLDDDEIDEARASGLIG